MMWNSKVKVREKCKGKIDGFEQNSVKPFNMAGGSEDVLGLVTTFWFKVFVQYLSLDSKISCLEFQLLQIWDVIFIFIFQFVLIKSSRFTSVFVTYQTINVCYCHRHCCFITRTSAITEIFNKIFKKKNLYFKSGSLCIQKICN